MKKYFSLALILLLITGCSITKVEEESFDSIINTVLYKDTNLANISFDGYKFYLPRGAVVSEKKQSNLEIKDKKNYYYLYIDTISYFYKTKEPHKIDSSIYYSRDLNSANGFGYIDISKVNNKYFLEVMYNYAKIEAYVDEDNLYDAFLNICYILSTIDYNESVINYRLSNKELETTTEEFDIFKSKKDEDNFLQYIEEFDKYEDKKNTGQDQDSLETNETEELER